MSIKMSLAELEVNKRDGSKVTMNAVIDNSTTEALEKIETDKENAIQAIEQKKVKTLEEIPDEYEELVSDVSQLSESVTNLNKDLGSLEDLETADKSSVVAAINEVKNNGGGSSGDVSYLTVVDGKLCVKFEEV